VAGVLGTAVGVVASCTGFLITGVCAGNWFCVSIVASIWFCQQKLMVAGSAEGTRLQEKYLEVHH